LSNLLKREEHEGLKIESFRVREFEAHRVNPTKKSEEPSDGIGGKIEDHLSKIEMEAYEKGFQQGQKDGLVMGKKRLEETARRLEALIKSLSQLKKEVYRNSERELVELATEIARKILLKELELDDTAILRTVRRAISFLNDRSNVRIRLNPSDMNKVAEVLSEIRADKKIEDVELVEDSAVERGGCILESGFGLVNATIEDQLSAISEELEEELKSGGQDNATVP